METYALAAALTQTWADVVLTGALTLDQLRGNIAALTLSVDANDLGIDVPDPRPGPRSQRAARSGAASRLAAPELLATRPNDVWSWDISVPQ